METLNIRKGIQEDTPGCLALIRELSVYEKAPESVIITPKDFIEDGFGKHPIFEFFVAEENGQIVGMALYYEKYSTWTGRGIYLEDLIVTQTHRRKGIGRKLFDKVVQVSKGKKVQRLEWQVLEWNEPALNFYSKYKATMDAEWLNGKLTFNQIQSFNRTS